MEVKSMNETITLEVEVDARLAIGFLKILRVTAFIWKILPKTVLLVITQNIQHLIRIRIEGYRNGKWFWC